MLTVCSEGRLPDQRASFGVPRSIGPRPEGSNPAAAARQRKPRPWSRRYPRVPWSHALYSPAWSFAWGEGRLEVTVDNFDADTFRDQLGLVIEGTVRSQPLTPAEIAKANPDYDRRTIGKRCQRMMCPGRTATPRRRPMGSPEGVAILSPRGQTATPLSPLSPSDLRFFTRRHLRHRENPGEGQRHPCRHGHPCRHLEERW